MKTGIKAMTLGLAFALTSASSALAMSELISLSVTPLWPTNTNPGNVLLYGISVERAGSGLLSVDLSTTGLPAGAQVSFTYDPARFTGNDPRFLYFLMTITTTQPTPTDAYPFVVTGKARRESISVTNTIPGDLRESTAPPLFVSLSQLKGGGVELRGLGYSGESYRIEATADLGNPNWTFAGNSTADGNGRFTFLHAAAQLNAAPLQFYRAVKLSPTIP